MAEEVSQKAFKNLFEDFLSMVEGNVMTRGIWREDPVHLMEFFTSKDFLNERPYPGKQTQFLVEIDQILWWKFTEKESLCPEELRTILEYIAMAGKGAGKDFLVSAIICYIAYLLCCLNDPQGFFNFARDENIDIVNIADNSNQARNVFFLKLKARFKNCKWFRKYHDRPTTYNQYQAMKDQIRLYKNITCHSTHSEAESFEGFNPLVVIFDEYGGFEEERAAMCYRIFRSSAITRYKEKILLIFISYPRYEDCPMMRKYNEYEHNKDPEVWGIRGATWEFRGDITKEAFSKDYTRDPETARLMYETIPPKHKEGFFQFPERIDEVTRFGKFAQTMGVTIEEVITERILHDGSHKYFVGLEIQNLHLDPQYTYYIGGDCGVSGDTYCISLCHGEPTLISTVEDGESVTKMVNKPVEDLLLVWKPNKVDRLPVDLVNVADTLEMICRLAFVKKALFDKFNSAEVTQRLMSCGVEAEDKAFSNPFQYKIYSTYKSLIYTGMVEQLDYIPKSEDEMHPNLELKSLQCINGSKIDHPKQVTSGGKTYNGAKDKSDARASGFYICSMDEVDSPKHFSMPMIYGVTRK